MNVSLPAKWEQFVLGQVTSGEYGNASEVVREGLRMLRGRHERRALDEMTAAFAGVDEAGGFGEPTRADRNAVRQIINKHRRNRPSK